MNPIAAQRLKSNNWDPAQSSVLKAIQAQWDEIHVHRNVFLEFILIILVNVKQSDNMTEKWRK